MILIDTPCEQCKHYIGLINSWHCGCKAFPMGFPKGFSKVDVTELKECANGFKWEPKEKEND